MNLPTASSIAPAVAPRRLHLESWLPSRCQICHAWPAAPLCGECVTRFARPLTRCERCALPLQGSARVCGACLLEPSPLDACFCAVAYEWPWTECLARFKFRQDTGLGSALAALMMHSPGVRASLVRADMVVPMPLSAQRLSERGYNQSLLLAHSLASKGVRADLLLRMRHTPPQRDMTRDQRLKSLRGAFEVDPLRAADLRGRRAILVDDVMTTGATLRAAARELRQAGVTHITALVVARTAA